jgi:hypothetical protein
MNTELFIETLKREQAQLALNSLLLPRAKDSYEFGLACGLVQAYDRMLAILKEQQDAADGKERSDQRPAVRSNPYLAELDQAQTLPEQYRRR